MSASAPASSRSRFLVAALAVGLAVGPVHIGVGSILRSALSYVPFLHVHQPLGAVDHAVLWQLRAPRVALAALVGGMLAVAGASYQGVFRNPLVRPVPARRRRRRGSRRDARDRLRVRSRDGKHLDGAARRVRRRDRRRRRHLRARPLGRRRADDRRARARRRHDGDLHGGGADVRPAAAHAAAAERLLVAARRLLDRDLARRRDLRAVHRGRARSCSSCTGACSTSSASATTRPRASAIDVGRARLAIVVAATLGHGRGRVGERPDRVRRDHRPAHDPAARLDELPGASSRSRCSPAPASSSSTDVRRADGPLAGRAADRRRHGVPRRAVLRRSSSAPRGRCR